MHRKHGIDRGTEGSRAWGEYPGGVWGAPSPEVTTYFQHNYCTARFLGFGSVSFQSVMRVGLFNCSQPPDVQTVDCRNSVCRNRVCRNNVVYPSAGTVWGPRLSKDTVRVRDIGVSIAGHLYLRLGVTIATAKHQ